MNTLRKNKKNIKVANVFIANRTLHLKTETGEEAICQLDDYPLLKHANDRELQDYTLSHFGIHWKKLNEDLMFKPMFKF